MPFVVAAKMLSYFTKVDEVSKPTVRRIVEKAGQACVEVQAVQVDVLERELPQSPERWFGCAANECRWGYGAA